jgi:hypothetical protein
MLFKSLFTNTNCSFALSLVTSRYSSSFASVIK